LKDYEPNYPLTSKNYKWFEDNILLPNAKNQLSKKNTNKKVFFQESK